MSDWFAPKRFGYGAGLPVSWQGWTISAIFATIMIGAALLLGRRPPLILAVLVPVIVVFSIVAARTTRGGWRWRWGDGD